MGDIVYKVVCRNYENSLVSCTAYGQAQVKYPVGVFVQAPAWLAKRGYHIIVFNTFVNALDFYKTCGETSEIWEADAEEEVSLPLMFLDLYDIAHGYSTISVSTGWPTGTRMYKRVKLFRRVK